jgi:hypothetical protein
MSSAPGNFNFIVSRNDRMMDVQSKKINILLCIVTFLLISSLFAYSYKFFINYGDLNIYPYDYNTEQGDYDLSYLTEQSYITKLSPSDFNNYLTLSAPEKLIAIKKNMITSITA